ncbi:hypothetical protein COU80_06100 [Candidatus Peregrinibacteria bacterium CG10_big_fil_rev_8_21_14_0_10_55_24]|nr:MAG: hypothetical protein COU80_06100 [Candidatus Peregrinibacteria bacterium CG10_big_fil_rev_8_21_14_0_10_55_24]
MEVREVKEVREGGIPKVRQYALRLTFRTFHTFRTSSISCTLLRMPSYAAFLGHQPHLSLAELTALLPDCTVTDSSFPQIVVFQTMRELDQEFLKTLGGTMVIARSVLENTQSVTLEDVPQILLSALGSGRGKATFSLRTVGLTPKSVRMLYRRCKDRLKDAGRPSRYVGNEKKPALPLLLHQHDMLTGKRGCELVILILGKEEERTLWIGRTVAAQDVVAYTHRDVEKPVRDTTVGLLPPKLAQMLMNFGLFLVRSQRGELPTKRSKPLPLTVYDPFCGTGVIPMECLVRGWNVLASDLSQKAVNGCTKNIEWIRKELKILKKDVASTVWKQDAGKPFDLKKTPPDVIVTETSLGPSLIARPTQKDVSKLKAESEKLQASFLENAAKTLPSVPIVCAWPAWRQKGGWVHLENIWKTVEKLKYRPMLPPHTDPLGPRHFSLLYQRSDQFVGREIVLLMPPKTTSKEA